MSHPATAEEAAAGGGKNGVTTIIVGETQVCPEDIGAGISEDAGIAKAYLLSIARDLRNSQAPPTRERINRLNNSFAICEAKFLKAYTNAYGPIYVASAFRCGPNTPKEIECDRTENGRAGGAPNSNHQIGIAVDVNPADGNYARAQSFAQSNPQYGVWFRLGMGDPPHMEPVNRANPSCSGVEGTPVTSAGARTPSSSVSDYVRDYLGGSDQSSAACNACRENPDNSNACMQCSGGSQPRTGAMPAYGSQPAGNASPGGNPGTAQQSTPSSAQQPVSSALGNTGTPSTSGTSQNTGISSALNPTPTGLSNPVSSLLNTSSDTKSPAFDLIGNLAFPTTTQIVAQTSATGSPIALNNTTAGDVVAINNTSGSPQGTANNAIIGQNISTLTPGGQQTFVSEDLSGGVKPIRAGGTFQTNTVLYNVLESLKQILLKFLDIIRPFRGFGSTGFGEGE